MLEDLAIQFVNQSEDTLRGISLGLIIVGAVIAAIITRSRDEIARAPYFAYSALIFFAVSAVEIVWLQSIPAMIGGYLWVLMAISITTTIAAGFFLCRIAMARSRDIHGHGRMAILAFIPIANFWLLFAPSKKELSHNRVPTIPLLTGGLGVLTGIVLFAAGIGVTVYIESQTRFMEQDAQTQPMAQQAGIESLLRSQGLEETLKQLAAAVEAPIAVDSVTTLARIEATGTQLRRTYVIDVEGMTMTDDFRTSVRSNICAHGPLISLLREGATIREVYVEQGGRQIGSVMVTRRECGV